MWSLGAYPFDWSWSWRLVQPGAGQFAGLASLERFGKYDIAVVVIEDHHVIVAVRRLYGELACLV